MRRALSPLVWLVLGCTTLTATEVLVHVDADTISKERGRELHVRVVNQDGATRLDRLATLFGQPPEVSLPTTVPVVPRDDDAKRTFTISAELVDAKGVAFNKKAALLSFVENETVDVDLYFSDLCIGIDCPEGQTCAEGECVDIRTPPRKPGGAQASDAQLGVCSDLVCWEEPRPTGEHLWAACLTGADTGFVAGNTILRLADGIWTPETAVPSPSAIHALACWPNGHALASAGGLVLERTSNGWAAQQVGAPFLVSIWGPTPAEVWVVGSAGQVFRRQNGGAWVELDAGVTADLNGVWGTGPADVFIAGSGDTLLHYDGTKFAAVAAPAAAGPDLVGVAGTSANDFSVNDGLQVISYDGAGWTAFVGDNGWSSIGASPEGFMVAGGGRGQVAFRTQVGAPFAPPPAPFPFTGPALRGNAVLGTTALLGGDAGLLARWDGAKWLDESVTVTQAHLNGVANDPEDPVHAIAVGAGGTVLERVGEGIWRRRVVGDGPDVVTQDLAAVWMRHDLAVAVGAAGTIAESTNGYDWSVVPSSTSAELAVVDAAGGSVFAAGAGGALLVREAGGSWKPFAPAAPTSAGVTAMRGLPDGTLFLGTDAGTVLELAKTATWTTIGTRTSAVTDLRVDSAGTLWGCAGDGMFHVDKGTFVEFSGSSAGVVRLLLDGTAPTWETDLNSTKHRAPDGTYEIVAPAMSAFGSASDGRAFMVGAGGMILAAASH